MLWEAMFCQRNIQAGLDAARLDSNRKSSHLHVEADGALHKVLRYWDTGFSAGDSQPHRSYGRVNLYDGAAICFSASIVAVAQEATRYL